MSYGQLAYVYDAFMSDAPYEKWVRFTCDQWARFGQTPDTLVDLGCGTGSFSLRMAAERDINVIGIDQSPDMLAVFRAKAGERGKHFPLYEQDLRDWVLDERVDTVVSYCDVFNYVTEDADVKKAFACVYRQLHPGGLFLFDVHAPRKAERMFHEKTHTWVDEEICYVWEADYDETENLVRHDVTFFVREGDLYRRFDETHFQRIYTVETLSRWLAEAGFRLRDCTGDFGRQPSDERSERVFFVAQK